MAVFIAITSILSRFFAIHLEILKITFSFIPIALAAMLFGPIYGGLVAGIEHLIGTIFPRIHIKCSSCRNNIWINFIQEA